MTVVLGIFYAEDAADYGRLSMAAGGLGFRVEEQEEAVQCRLLRDIVGPYEDREAQIRWIARDLLPLLADLR